VSRPALSVQLYSVRDLLADDPAATLRALADLGLTAVEPYGLTDYAATLAPLLRDLGLEAPTAHTSLVGEGVDLDAVFAAAELTGTTTLFEPAIGEERWTDAEGVLASAAALSDVAVRAADRGIRVGYHNHWWELENRIGGVPALTVFLEALSGDVLLEVDAYWAAVGGADPAALLAEYGSRVAAIHVKDGPISRDTEAQLPAGSGAMPLGAVLAAAPDARPVLEFDAYAGDILEGIASSIAGYRALTGDAA